MPQDTLVHGFIGLGSNLGDPPGNIARALREVDTAPGLRVEAVSPLYWTEPQGVREQNWFANCVARIQVRGLTPEDVLAVLAGIERAMGRVRDMRWGPRIIDIDILLLGDTRWESQTLHIPHPRLGERAFVLVPLMDLAPDILIHGFTPSQWLSRLTYSVEGNEIRQPLNIQRGE